MAIVKLTNVCKKYDKKEDVYAVKDFNLEIADKEFIVFVGPSGCGKSTTLRMIAGLEDISEGTIEFDGEVVNDLQPKDRNIAMVFQNYALYPHLTVFENIAFPLRLDKSKRFIPFKEEEIENLQKQLASLAGKDDKKSLAKRKMIEEMLNQGGRLQKGYTQDEIYSRVVSAAETLGITEFLTRKPRALSGGQRQRVAIGRAMVRDSKVFLMDEPLSNLDAKLRNQMRAEIILLRKKINTTFVYVTHDQTEAMTLGDRIVIMKKGIVMQIGSPDQVFDQPANLFVAEFIGAPKMNTFKAILTNEKSPLSKEGGKYFVSAFGAKLEVTGEKNEMLTERGYRSQEIILGVRPEHMVLKDRPDPSCIEAQIVVNEMMGSELYLHVAPITDPNSLLIVRVPTIQLTKEQREKMVAGSTIYLSFEGKVMHFFNPETEQNLLYY